MSNLSGYDSEATGFNSISQNKNQETDNSTQTTEFAECGVGSQTNMSKDCGCNACPGEVKVPNEVIREYPPPGLNEFLRRVVPSVMDQLNENVREIPCDSSDSEEEEFIVAKLFQEIKNYINNTGTGDDLPNSVTSVAWSNAGNSIAVSIGKTHHEKWCEHSGLIRIFTAKRSDGDKFVHSIDITEKNCITVAKYHQKVAALLAYGTTSGDVVVCNLRNVNAGAYDQAAALIAPGGHDSHPVTCLQWADPPLANMFLLMHILGTGRRRGAADQILISSGSDGTINVWQVNAHTKVVQNIVCYKINGTRKITLDITCFDFFKECPLRTNDGNIPKDVFVVGTSCGKIYSCSIENFEPIVDSAMVDPVLETFQGHQTCVVAVMFSSQLPGIFASISIDSDLKVFNVNQNAPLKVICIEGTISCMAWVPNNPCLVIIGLAKVIKTEEMLKVYNISTARKVPVEGFTANSSSDNVTITSVAVNESGVCRVAAGDTASNVYVWDLPFRRIDTSAHDLQFSS